MRVDDAHGDYIKLCSPTIAVSKTSIIYVAWSDNRSGNSDIYFAKSANGGQTFSENVRVNDGDIEPSLQLDPDITIDTYGNIYLVWIDCGGAHPPEPMTNSGWPHIYFAKSTDGGVSFSEEVRVDDATRGSGQFTPSIAVDRKGIIYITWSDGRVANTYYKIINLIYFTKSINGGKSFLPNKRVEKVVTSVTQWTPEIALDNKGNIFIVWQNYFDIKLAISTSSGRQFNIFVQVEDTGDLGTAKSMQISPAIAINGNKDVYIVWSDHRNDNWDVYSQGYHKKAKTTC